MSEWVGGGAIHGIRQDWKNCGRKERDVVLPEDKLRPKLAELGAIMPDGTPVC